MRRAVIATRPEVCRKFHVRRPTRGFPVMLCGFEAPLWTSADVAPADDLKDHEWCQRCRKIAARPMREWPR